MNKTTDEMVELIIKRYGYPLPTYNYEIGKYVSAYLVNENFNGIILGIEAADTHDTFREACESIINWHKQNKENER